MNRRSFFSKLGLPLVVAVASPVTLLSASEPKPDYILNVGQPLCPHCHIAFFLSHETYDNQTNTAEIFHDVFPSLPCPLAGKKLRINLGRLKATIVD